MAILISKCCVCGKVYNKKKCHIKGRVDNEECISHGICSDKCHEKQYGVDLKRIRRLAELSAATI